MVQISLEEAQLKLPDLVNAVLQGEKVYIQKDNKKIIQLLPVISDRPSPKFGNAKGLIEMADDFDAPLTDFNEYMQ